MKMTIKEASSLIQILKKENENNSATDKKFNLEWIKCLEKSIVNALKIYNK
jgi:hypothetical protein